MQHVEQPSVHRRITGYERSRFDRGRHAIDPGDDSASFTYQQNAGRHVPGRQVQLPEGVEPSASDPREVDRSRAGSPDSRRSLGDRNELARITHRIRILAERKAGADERFFRIRDLRNVKRYPVQSRAHAAHRGVQLAVRNVQHQCGDRFRVVDCGYRYRVRRDPVQKIRGAVERIDDKRESAWKRLIAPALLAQYAQVGKIDVQRAGDLMPDQRFGGRIYLRQVIGQTLRLPDKVAAAGRTGRDYTFRRARRNDHRVEDSCDDLASIWNRCLTCGHRSYIWRMARVFSGIQPSGELHIGNYLGAVRNWVELQHRYESFFSIVDYHAITGMYEPADLRRRTRDMAISLLASGIDPEKCTLFVQSAVSEHTELAWIFNTVTPLGELERQTQFKDKSSRQESILAGLLNYPVLQAADVALYQSELIPVGEDQVQHLELAREIVRRWNSKFGIDFFVEPKPLLTPTRRIMGLDGQAKMSKSLGNTIGLLEEPAAIWEKLRPAVTDPARVKKTDPGTPEVCNIYHIHKAFSSPATVEHVAQQCSSAGWGCIDCKRVLQASMETELGPIRARAAELRAAPERVEDALSAGAASAKAIASATLTETKQIMGLR